MKSATLRIWQATHTWSSLISMLFLLMLCLTGLPLIFAGEIDDWARASPPTAAVEDPLGADYYVAAAGALNPGYVVTKLQYEDHGAVLVSMQRSLSHWDDKGAHFVQFDAGTGRVTAQFGIVGGRLDRPRTALQKTMKVIEQLHVDMYAGSLGRYFLGTMGLLLVVATVSGIVLYQPFMRKLPFGAVRAERSTRIKWLDLHNLLGVVTLAWVSVVAMTGIIHDLGDPLSSMRQAGHVEPLRQKYAHEEPLGHDRPVSLQGALEAAERQVPDFQAEASWLPGVFTPAHFWLKGHGATTVTKKLRYEVLVDARTGEVTDTVTMPWYWRMLEMSRPLHFGDYGGLQMKFLWLLLDLVAIVILVSGLYLWIARRKAAHGASKGGRMHSPLKELSGSAP